MCLRLRRSEKVRESMLSGPASGLTTLAVGPFEKLRAGSTGLEVQTASSKHFQDKPVELQIPRLRSEL